jgi:hypothetical protein
MSQCTPITIKKEKEQEEEEERKGRRRRRRKNHHRKKGRCGEVAQMVGHLASKYKSLNLNPSTTKIKNKKRRKYINI